MDVISVTVERGRSYLTRDECCMNSNYKFVGEGNSYREFGRRFGVSHATFSRVIRRYRMASTNPKDQVGKGSYVKRSQ